MSLNIQKGLYLPNESSIKFEQYMELLGLTPQENLTLFAQFLTFLNEKEAPYTRTSPFELSTLEGFITNEEKMEDINNESFSVLDLITYLIDLKDDTDLNQSEYFLSLKDNIGEEGFSQWNSSYQDLLNFFNRKVIDNDEKEVVDDVPITYLDIKTADAGANLYEGEFLSSNSVKPWKNFSKESYIQNRRSDCVFSHLIYDEKLQFTNSAYIENPTIEEVG